MALPANDHLRPVGPQEHYHHHLRPPYARQIQRVNPEFINQRSPSDKDHLWLGCNFSSRLRIGLWPMVREARSSGLARSAAQGQANAAGITNPACARSRAARRAADGCHQDGSRNADRSGKKKPTRKLAFSPISKTGPIGLGAHEPYGASTSVTFFKEQEHQNGTP